MVFRHATNLNIFRNTSAATKACHQVGNVLATSPWS